MESPSRFSNTSRPALGWNTGIWLLAAAFGATSVLATAQIVHESGQRLAASRLFAQVLAGQVYSQAGERLELLAYDKLSPTMPSASASAFAERMRSRERAIRSCNCDDSIAATQYFRWRANGGDAVDVVAVDSGPVVNAATLASIARADANRQGKTRPSVVHFTANRSLGDRAVVTIASRATSDAADEVYGFVMNARAAAMYMLEPLLGANGVVTLDTASLTMSTLDSVPLYGAAPPPSSTPSARVGGPLDNVRLRIALVESALPWSLSGPRRRELYHLGMLTLATAALITLAARRSRREVLLARARSDFVAGVSHDLRMPLAQILLASETLTGGRARDESERMRLASSILREGRRLIGMVENILVFSQSGAIGDQPLTDRVRLDDVFEDTVEAVQLAVDDAAQRIVVRGESSMSVIGGRRQLRQALVNYIDNAIKYGKPGQTIEIAAEPAANDRVRVIVRDEGPGIPAKERERVFDAYRRLERDESSERTGTGLGLAVVRHIAAQCGGRAWLEDAPAGGTRAVLELMLAASAAEAAVEPERAPEPV